MRNQCENSNLLFVVITFERFEISKKPKKTFEILDKTMHVQNLKFLA